MEREKKRMIKMFHLWSFLLAIEIIAMMRLAHEGALGTLIFMGALSMMALANVAFLALEDFK